MVNDKTDEVNKEDFNYFLTGLKLDWKHQREVMNLSLIVFIYCIINVIK